MPRTSKCFTPIKVGSWLLNSGCHSYYYVTSVVKGVVTCVGIGRWVKGVFVPRKVHMVRTLKVVKHPAVPKAYSHRYTQKVCSKCKCKCNIIVKVNLPPRRAYQNATTGSWRFDHSLLTPATLDIVTPHIAKVLALPAKPYVANRLDTLDMVVQPIIKQLYSAAQAIHNAVQRNTARRALNHLL